MDTAELIQKLKNKRKEIADREGTELYMVLPNKTIEETAKAKPETEEDLLSIKGWGKVKVRKYGKDMLSIIHGDDSENEDPLLNEAVEVSDEEDHVYSVGSYLEFLNIGLKKSGARVKGEITSFNPRKGDSYLFFSLTDEDSGSVMSCFMWQNDLDISGVDLEEGMEVIVDGYPKIHKPTGRFSFQVSMVELSGEGALKKAYEKLKKKLKEEGLFSKERKKPLPKFPKNIGVITSLKGGTVIHDFQNNLGKFGFTIKGIDARVEGKKAVKSLLKSIKTAENLDIDVLVIIRGGGSIESLQAFDNESLVRAVADFPVPVIAGIGHHEDVTLTALVADAMESTPQGVAEMLNKPWEEARGDLRIYERSILSSFENMLVAVDHKISKGSEEIRSSFSHILDRFRNAHVKFREKISNFGYEIDRHLSNIKNYSTFLISSMERAIKSTNDTIHTVEKTLDINNPKRQLRLGYSIVSKNGKVVRSVDDVDKKDSIDITVSDGKIRSEVKNKDKSKENG